MVFGAARVYTFTVPGPKWKSWVKGRGRPLVVRDPYSSKAREGNELDEFADSAIRAARQNGYSLQQLIEHLREHLLAEPPDHILVVSDESGMRVLMTAELSEHFYVSMSACSTGQLIANRDLLLGALLVTAPGNIPTLGATIPAERPAIPVIYSSAAEHTTRIRQLEQPSMILVASISEYFLEMASGVLAPAMESRHSLRSLLITPQQFAAIGATDVIFCDSCAYSWVRSVQPRAEIVRHQLIAPDCLDQIQAGLEGQSRIQEGSG